MWRPSKRELNVLPSLKTERVAIDLVGSEASVGDLVSVLESVGFRQYARLIRLARASQPNQPQPSRDGTEVIWAQKTDHQAIMNLLETSFDRYADQLPMPYEIEAAIEAQQILAVRCEGALAALLFFETQGLHLHCPLLGGGGTVPVTPVWLRLDSSLLHGPKRCPAVHTLGNG